jgi:hypothetical protein
MKNAMPNFPQAAADRGDWPTAERHSVKNRFTAGSVTRPRDGGSGTAIEENRSGGDVLMER